MWLRSTSPRVVPGSNDLNRASCHRNVSSGAKTAQGTAERHRLGAELIKEIRATNAAISVCISVFNAAAGLKNQQVRPMKDAFDKARLVVVEHRRKLVGGETLPPPRVFADLRLLPMPSMPTDTLRSHLLERLSATGRPLSLATEIESGRRLLDEVITHRNTLIADGTCQ